MNATASAHHEVGSPDFCRKCGATVVGAFCSHCGEKRLDPHDLSLGHFVHHSLHDLTHFDTKLFRSLWPLLTKPGLLTREWIDGRRTRYVKPLQMFIMLNILFFFFGSMAGLLPFTLKMYEMNRRPIFFALPVKPLVEKKLAATHLPREEFEAKFDEKIAHEKKSLVLTMVPLFACVLALLYARRKRYFAEHLVFSLHFFCFFLLLFLLATPLILILRLVLGHISFGAVPGHRQARQVDELFFLVPIITGWCAYLAEAARRVYGSRRIASIAQALLLTFAVFMIFLIYRDAVFYVSLLTM